MPGPRAMQPVSVSKSVGRTSLVPDAPRSQPSAVRLATGPEAGSRPVARPGLIGLIAVSCWLGLTAGLRAEAPPAELLGYKLLFSDRFESDTSDSYEFSDPQAWKWQPLEGRGVLSQFQASKVQTPVRSPFNRALVRNLVVGDFVLDVKLQSTIKDYDHRDLCLFFGFQDPAHLYYVHLGKKADDHANQIFIVNGEPRRKISLQSTPGTPWTDGWHHARVVRRVASGTIEVFFDDLETPVMRAQDTTFAWGQVGLGSFDDTGNFDELTVFGKRVARPAVK